MSQRLRLYDVRMSRLPSAVGLCASDGTAIALMVNAAQQRLMFAKEAREEGWFGTFAEMVFNVSRPNPYITLPREVARIEVMAVCGQPIQIQNAFYEYLEFGNGTMPRACPWKWAQPLQVYSRNNAVTFTDLSAPPKLLRAYFSALDKGRRALIQGTDSNNLPIFSQDGFQRVTGQFAIFDTSFVTWPQQFNSISGIQKDATSDPVNFYEVDPNTGAETLLLTMAPGETTAWYRRYLLNPLPCHGGCHPDSTPQTVKVRAIVKLEPIPVAVDTDYLVLSNLEAIIAECQSIRLSEVDSSDAKQQSRERHQAAIALLIGEASHYFGIDKPAVQVKPFGSASLAAYGIGVQT